MAIKKISESALKKTITSLAEGFDRELFEKTKEELEEYWYFKWDASQSVCRNIYEFHDKLKLYGSFCRRWEEKHNGSCCIVGRIRDKYLMPKIQEFYRVFLENNK